MLLTHTHSHSTSCGLWIDNSVPVLTDRCLDRDSPRQGPCTSQQRVHHGHREVLPLPGVEFILFHGFGHGQLLEQMMHHPENQGERQHWRARVTLERRDQRVHPRLLPRSPLWPRSRLLSSSPPLLQRSPRLVDWQMCAVCDGSVLQDCSCRRTRPRFDWWSLTISAFRCPEPSSGRTGGYSRQCPFQCDGVSQRGLAPLSARLPEEWGWEWWWLGGEALQPPLCWTIKTGRSYANPLYGRQISLVQVWFLPHKTCFSNIFFTFFRNILQSDAPSMTFFSDTVRL